MKLILKSSHLREKECAVDQGMFADVSASVKLQHVDGFCEDSCDAYRCGHLAPERLTALLATLRQM